MEIGPVESVYLLNRTMGGGGRGGRQGEEPARELQAIVVIPPPIKLPLSECLKGSRLGPVSSKI